jgi:MFS transporter, ACS family, tartrate transporter
MQDAIATDRAPPVGAAGSLLDAACRRNAWRIIPFLALAYVVNFLDRTSVGYAGLQMNGSLGLTPAQFGAGAGIVFVGYCLLEVPSNLLMYRVGARRWIARIMITWGLAATATALAVGPWSFYGFRFLLGAAEAGFFPGVIWYLSIWFPAGHRTRALAWFAAAAPFSQLIGGPVSVTLLRLDGVLGLAGWQWMFLLEGVPAILLGLLALRVLADGPERAPWLDATEREAIATALATEARDAPHARLGAALRDWRVFVSAAVVFCYTVGSYGLGLWLPLILKGHGLSTTAIGWVSVIPFGAATVATILFARFVDRTGLKFWTLVLTLVLGIAGMVLSVWTSALAPTLLWISVGLIGAITARTVFYTIPQHFLMGAAAAGGLAFINSIGSLGGFVGPAAMGWLAQATGSFNAGLIAMAGFMVLAILAAAVLRRGVRGI